MHCLGVLAVEGQVPRDGVRRVRCQGMALDVGVEHTVIKSGSLEPGGGVRSLMPRSVPCPERGRTSILDLMPAEPHVEFVLELAGRLLASQPGSVTRTLIRHRRRTNQFVFGLRADRVRMALFHRQRGAGGRAVDNGSLGRGG